MWVLGRIIINDVMSASPLSLYFRCDPAVCLCEPLCSMSLCVVDVLSLNELD